MAIKWCLFLLLLLIYLLNGYKTVISFTGSGDVYEYDELVTDYRWLYADMTIPDMFVLKDVLDGKTDEISRRRLEEHPINPAALPTKPPSVYHGPKKLLLPVVVLIPPEGI